MKERTMSQWDEIYRKRAERNEIWRRLWNWLRYFFRPYKTRLAGGWKPDKNGRIYMSVDPAVEDILRASKEPRLKGDLDELTT